MTDMRTVAICGSSLVLSSIRASLEQRAGWQVFAFDTGMPAGAERLGGFHPDAVIFDLASMQSDPAIALWRAQPHVLLVGIDMEADQALVISGQSSRVLTPDDLVRVIEAGALAAREDTARSKGGEPG
jgi:ABC-type bacteriocin/lantibiotic exporter with double-glycine peptidase domain